ncbi:MAG TPA: SPOR domain-containing protein [Allosphingosinicella sp.]|jgi:hypothetical protein
MTDIRADDAAALDRDDRLPWLEAVEEEDGGDGPSGLKLLVYVIVALVALGGVVGGVFWLGNRGGGGQESAGPELVRAPEGPYKAKPDKPGGMAVEGEGDTAFAASAGADPKGQINTDAVPEKPVVGRDGAGRPPVQPEAQPKVAPPAPSEPAKPAATAAAKPVPPAASGPGGTIQLGAFPNGATAEKAWKAMSGRFGYLAPLSHSVVVAEVNGRTWYRLRASGPGAGGVCGRLQVAGENCLKID